MLSCARSRGTANQRVGVRLAADRQPLRTHRLLGSCLRDKAWLLIGRRRRNDRHGNLNRGTVAGLEVDLGLARRSTERGRLITAHFILGEADDQHPIARDHLVGRPWRVFAIEMDEVRDFAMTVKCDAFGEARAAGDNP